MVNAGGLDGRAGRGETGRMSDEKNEDPQDQNPNPPAVRRLLAEVMDLHDKGRSRHEAGVNLLKAFAAALRAEEGFYFKTEDGYYEAGLEFFRKRGIATRVGPDGLEMWVVGSTGDDDFVPGLKYDAFSKSYVGTDPDPDIVPTPGQPYPKKDALRIMVERFAELMTQA